jgi:streptogramin lyase
MRTARVAVVTALVLLGGAATAAAALSGPPRLEGLRVLDRIPLGDLGAGVTYADGAVWVQTVTRNQLVRIDPKTNRITARLKLPDPSSGDAEQVAPPPAYGAGSLWMIGGTDGVSSPSTVIRINPRRLSVAKTIKVSEPFYVGFGFGSVWVMQFYPYRWSRIDPRSNKVVESVSAIGPTSMTTGAGSVWILAHRANQLVRLNPRTGDVVAAIRIKTLGSSTENVNFGFGSIWITDPLAPSVARVDVKTNKQRVEILMPKGISNPDALTSGGGFVWLASDHDLVRVDPRTNRVTGALVVRPARKNPPCGPSTQYNCFPGVTFGDGSVWAVDNSRHEVLRVAPA